MPICILAVSLILGSVAWPGARIAAQGLDGATGLVTGSGDGVLLRAEPGFGAEVIGTAADGTVVGLRIAAIDTVLDPDGATRWWPVDLYGQEGWIAGYFLETGIPAADGTTGASGAEAEAVAVAEEAPATVAPSDEEFAAGPVIVSSGDGANLRQDPWTGSEVLVTLAYGTPVDLRIAEADTVYAEGERWWPVASVGQTGWIAGSSLGLAGAVQVPVSDAAQVPADAPAVDPIPVDEAPAPAPSVVNDPVRFKGGDYVTSTDGDTVNIRVEAAVEASRVGQIPGGDVVQVMDGPYYDTSGTGWYLLTDGDVTGFSDGNLLTVAAQPEPPARAARAQAPAPTPTPIPAPVSPSGPTGAFINPVPGAVFTQAYGCSIYAFEPYEASLGCNFHNGIDLAADAYTGILAADGGTVVAAGWCDCGLGFYAEIDHGNGLSTVYGHMAEQPYVAVGQSVGQGAVIGPVGSTGLSTGPHVHFMLKVNGGTVDPLGYVAI